ncbi:CHAD domain-containing protein [Chitinophaga sp. MM2321]|uniref:CHAD domain-containing protein n=1 Tax=Chitinophaga sp. MM2321 TaxID=3137178 RepID=UPI0032D570F1
MLQAALYKYLRGECDTVVKAYTHLQQAPGDANAIHALRVSGKKIRAFFALVAQLPEYTFHPGKDLRVPKLIQAIGGTSRDTHLQEKFLARQEKSIGWRFSTAHLLLKNKQATTDTLMQAVIKRTAIKKTVDLPENFREAIADTDSKKSIETLLTFIGEQYSHTTLPASNAHHTVWHALRKHMKALYFQLTIMDQVLPASRGRKQLLQHTKTAGELLGQWHDANALLLFLKDTITSMKKEKMAIPVNAGELVKRIQLETKQLLAQCALHMRQAPVNISW